MLLMMLLFSCLLLLLPFPFSLFSPLFLLPVSVFPLTMFSLSFSTLSLFRLGRLARQLLVVVVLFLVMALMAPCDLHLAALRPLPGVSVARVASVSSGLT